MRFEGLRDVGDPVELGASYSDAGADELVFLDVKATLEERATMVALVTQIAERLAIPFTVGGGVRSAEDGEELLAAGADKVAVNSAALERPQLVTELAARLGSQAVVVAIDAQDGRVRSRAGTTETGRGVVEWAREAEDRGAGEILLTSIATDGTRAGYDLELTSAVVRSGRPAGDRLRRRRYRPARRRRARGRSGGSPRFDPARGSRPAAVIAGRAA